jgi:hypothetical protein
MPTLPVEVIRIRSLLPVFQMCSEYPAAYTVEPAALRFQVSSAAVELCKKDNVPLPTPDLVALILKTELSPTVSTTRPVTVLLLKLDEMRS